MNTQKYNIESSNRRLIFHHVQNFEECQILSNSTVRSVLFFYHRHERFELPIGCRRLNVLSAPTLIWPEISDAISTFVNLRYIRITLTRKSRPRGFLASITKLFHLQTLFVASFSVEVEVAFEILEMPKLRHLIIQPSFVLSHPSNVIQESDIQTLWQVKDFKLTEEAIKLMVNTKSMRLLIGYRRWDDLCLDNLFHLRNLEELRVMMSDSGSRYDRPPRIWNYEFPISLRILTLWYVRLPWDKMTIIGSLPNLQVLEIFHNCAEKVSEWMPIQGQFLGLKCLSSTFDHLVRWQMEKEHFPSLESLILKGARSMYEIPYGIGEIDTLQLIELHYCSESLVNSAKRIKEQQHENGNDAFQVLTL